MSRAIKYLSISLFSSFILGCSLLPHYGRLSALRKYGESQSEIKEDTREQKENFFRLKDDIEKNRIKPGNSKKYTFFKYGRPVFCKDVQDKPPSEQACIYRSPGDLDAGLIDLYFDKNNKLDSWEIVR